jgi:hypothetical protein
LPHPSLTHSRRKSGTPTGKRRLAAHERGDVAIPNNRIALGGTIGGLVVAMPRPGHAGALLRLLRLNLLDDFFAEQSWKLAMIKQ